MSVRVCVGASEEHDDFTFTVRLHCRRRLCGRKQARAATMHVHTLLHAAGPYVRTHAGGADCER